MKILKDLVQGSKEWLEERRAKVSGTRLATVMSGPKAVETLMFEMVAEMVSPIEEIHTTAAMQRGTDLEPYAIMKYEARSGKKIDQPGLVQKTDFIILSPDGLYYNKKGIVNHAIEVKCLAAKKQLRYMSFDSFIDVKTYEKQYFWQVVHYFVNIDTLETLDFVLYNPDIYRDDLESYTIRVTRKELEKYIKQAEERLEQFEKDFNGLKQKILG